MRRIKVWNSGTLTVSGTNAWDGTALYCDFNSDNSEAYSKAIIDGEILKIIINFTSSNTTAVLTISSRDTPLEHFAEITNWSSDVTLYPIIEGKTYQNGTAAASNKANVFQKYASSGSVRVVCSNATADDTADIKIYYR